MPCLGCRRRWQKQAVLADLLGFSLLLSPLLQCEVLTSDCSPSLMVVQLHCQASFSCFALMRADSFSFSQEDFLFDSWGSHVRKLVHPNLKRCEGLGNCNGKNILEEEINWCLVSPEPDFSCDEKAVKESCRSSPKSNISCTLGNLGIEKKK